VGDLKKEICKGKHLHCDDVRFISAGAECQDVDQAPSVCSAVVRSDVSRSVDVLVKVTGAGKVKSESIALSFPLNTRIKAIKAFLHKNKHAKWSVTGQRLISSSIVMKDYQLLGDFLLHQKKSLKPNHSSQFVLYLSQTVDSRVEIEFHVTLRNKQEIKFDLEFGIPLYYAKEILYNQFGIMKNLSYYFVEEKTGLHLTDMNKCLLDYGYLPTGGKKLHLVLALFDNPAPFAGLTFLDLKSLQTQQSLPKVPDSPKKRKRQQQCPNLVVSTNVVEVGEEKSITPSRSSSPILFASATLKKKPNGKKSPKCGMFGGMKKGFLSSSNKHRKKQH
jgi:hypothetical protein